jgi:hypothetical protein
MKWTTKTAALALMVNALGCGALAGPLSNSGVARPSADPIPSTTNTAWYVCFRGQYRELPADVYVLARYRHCQIVLTEGPQHGEMRIMSELLRLVHAAPERGARMDIDGIAGSGDRIQYGRAVLGWPGPPVRRFGRDLIRASAESAIRIRQQS